MGLARFIDEISFSCYYFSHLPFPSLAQQRNPQRMAELRDLCEVVTGAMSTIVQQRPQPPRRAQTPNPAAAAAAAAAANGHFHGSLTLASAPLPPDQAAAAAQQYFYLPNPHFFVSIFFYRKQSRLANSCCEMLRILLHFVESN